MAEHLVTVAVLTAGQLKPVFLSDSSEKGRILSVKSARKKEFPRRKTSEKDELPPSWNLISLPVRREPADFSVTVVPLTMPEQLE